MTAPHGPRILRRSICLIIHLSLTAFFWYAYQIRYRRHIDCFNSEGRCYISGEGVLTTSGAFWGVFALVFAGLAMMIFILLVMGVLRHRRSAR